jgi:hypothetical protein
MTKEGDVIGINRKALKYISTDFKIFLMDPGPFKVHKIENFFGSDFEICTFS